LGDRNLVGGRLSELLRWQQRFGIVEAMATGAVDMVCVLGETVESRFLKYLVV